jgi:hypothetical protein
MSFIKKVILFFVTPLLKLEDYLREEIGYNEEVKKNKKKSKKKKK